MINEKATVLFVDDEERILRSMEMLFRGEYNILTTTNGRDAIEMVKKNTVHVVVSDQRMPIMLGSEMLKFIKEASPNTMRILLTGYSDLSAVMDAVNEGEIFRYIHKPWVPEVFKETVAEGVKISREMFGTQIEVKDIHSTEESAGILVIDSDHETQAKVKEASHELPVHWGPDLDTAFEILDKKDIGVVVAELKDNGVDYSGVLKQLKQHNPQVVTIVATAFENAGDIIDLINEGQVYRYNSKPIRAGMMTLNIESALRYHYKLKMDPVLVKRHAVEKNTQQNTPAFPENVASYFKKIGASLLN